MIATTVYSIFEKEWTVPTLRNQMCKTQNLRRMEGGWRSDSKEQRRYGRVTLSPGNSWTEKGSPQETVKITLQSPEQIRNPRA
jgi:hypothetical protein